MNLKITLPQTTPRYISCRDSTGGNTYIVTFPTLRPSNIEVSVGIDEIVWGAAEVRSTDIWKKKIYSQNRYAGHEFWYLIDKLHHKPSSWSPVSSAGARTSPSVFANPFSNLTALPDLGSRTFSGLSPSVKNNKSYKKQKQTSDTRRVSATRATFFSIPSRIKEILAPLSFVVNVNEEDFSTKLSRQT